MLDSMAGGLEEEARQIRKRGQIKDAILLTLLVSGMVAIGTVPLQIVPALGFAPKDKRKFKNHASTAARRLVQQGLAAWVKKEGSVYLRLTPLGRKKLEFERVKMQLQTKRPRWDKRWRMVAFDLPERRRNTRTRLRRVMAEVGFMRLQDSVWIYPYDCEEFVALLKAELKVGKDALYAIVEKIENDRPLLEYFRLV